MLEREGPPESLEDADQALLAGGEDEAELAAEPAEPAAQPRDDEGRFTAGSEGEPEAPVEGDPALAPETTGEPTEPEAEAQDDYPTLNYRADNQEWDIPGSAVGDDGVFIPAAALPEVQNLLSAGRASFGSVRQRLTESAQREQQALDRVSAAEAQRDQILAHFEQLVEKSQHATTIEDLIQTPLGQWILGVRQNWPILKAQSQVQAAEAQRKAENRELERYREAEQQSRMQPMLDSTLRQSIQQWGPQLGVDQPTAEAVLKELQDPGMRSYVFVKAPYDDPGHGIRKGELVIDHAVVQRALRLASLNRTPPPAPRAAVAPQRQNVIPPSVGGKGRVPRSGPALPQFSSAKEADDFLVNGDLSVFEEE